MHLLTWTDVDVSEPIGFGMNGRGGQHGVKPAVDRLAGNAARSRDLEPATLIASIAFETKCDCPGGIGDVCCKRPIPDDD